MWAEHRHKNGTRIFLVPNIKLQLQHPESNHENNRNKLTSLSVDEKVELSDVRACSKQGGVYFLFFFLQPFFPTIK